MKIADYTHRRNRTQRRAWKRWRNSTAGKKYLLQFAKKNQSEAEEAYRQLKAYQQYVQNAAYGSSTVTVTYGSPTGRMNYEP